MNKAVVFSLPAAHKFEAGIALDQDWYKTLTIGGDTSPLVTVHHEGISYVFRRDETVPTGSIVIKVEPEKLFACFKTEDSRLEALQRSVKAGVMALENSGQLPDYWRPFSGGKFITFQAQGLSKGDQRRLVMSRRGAAPDGYAYVFDITRSQRDYEALSPDQDFVDRVLAGRALALAKIPKELTGVPSLGPTTLNLEPIPEQVDTVVHGWKLPYLYESRLTKKQKAFVDVELDRSVRLKGAAGTGKTLAMVAKLLREASLRKSAGKPFRFLFLTHNSSAAELAQDYAMALDSEDILFSTENNNAIEFDTLLNLAVRDLAEDLTDLQPISNDAHEGKKLQLIILSDTVKKFRDGGWITLKRGVSDSLAKGIEAALGSPEHEEFCWDVMNEIACVLDADGVRDNQAKRESYLKESRRPKYLMQLDGQRDREVLLALYDLYRATLRHEHYMSVDQVIADYLGYLDSFRWDARRARLGYDAVFVDEYHLFNRTERATFPALMRDRDAHRPIILMALDPRQSPKAVFLDAAFGGVEHLVPLAPGQAKQLHDFEFDEVFRYTPEIAEFLSFINHQFPEDDLSEEWLPGLATSSLAHGEKPTATESPDQTALYDAAVDAGLRLQKGSEKGKTAIITLSRKSFDVVSRASRFGNKIYVVDSRESLNRLQYVGSRIVFSMPDYVAGVQFDHVILTDVNELDDIGRPTALTRIRFGSNVYLGASRARKTVAIYANQKFGGLAPVIRRAIEQQIVAVR
jgi:hypothetical protein